MQVRNWAAYVPKRGYATVQWRTWAQSAFDQAREENKPLFVSSFSHSRWCELMASESFNDAAIVQSLNENFVPVRIQKDEERGIDKSLMMFLQLKANGQGGWPLNAVLTPSKFQPFVAASYLSPADLMKFLETANNVWKENAELCENIGNEAADQLVQIRDANHGKEDQLDKHDAREQAGLQYKSLSTQSPRFIMGYALSVLGGDLNTEVLHEIAGRGIVDYIDGGVYTYSISSDWHLPSFEKSLSGQATLLMACSTRLREDDSDTTVKALARSLVDFIAQLAPHTSITCPSDTWTYTEFTDALKAGGMDLVDRDIAQTVWGVNENGNINSELDAMNNMYGQNVLTRHKSNEDVAAAFGVPPQKVQQVYDDSISLLSKYKHAYKQPPATVNERDILSDLGLTLSGLSQVGKFDSQAKALALEIATKLQSEYKSPSQSDRTCDDYAFAIMGLLDFHKYVDPSNSQWVEAAHEWQQVQLEKFYDPINGGFFFSESIPNLYFRSKFTYDGAEPNYNGVSMRNLQRLADLGHTEYADKVAPTGDIAVHGALASPLAHLSFLVE